MVTFQINKDTTEVLQLQSYIGEIMKTILKN